MKELKDKVVLITGAAGGIGLNTAGFFAEAGCRLVLTDINEMALENAKQRLAKHGVDILTKVVDVTDLKAVESLRDDVVKKFGKLDVLINNAGIGYNAEIADTPLSKWQQLMNINFWAPLYHIQTFLPLMKEKKSGHIVNVSSGQAYFRAPTWGAYSVTKLAVGAMSEIMNVEVARDNIKVTTVYPFLVNTGFYDTATANSIGEQLFFMFMPLYSDKPETVARMIFDSVREEKDVEMVSILNQFFKFARVINPVANVMDKTTHTFMSKQQQETLGIGGIVDKLGSILNSIMDTAKKGVPEKGFQIHEVMSGEHEFVDGFGPAGKHKFEFKADWGPKNLVDFVNPGQDKFMLSELAGTVTIGGMCENMPVYGTLQLRYFQDQKIRYTFDFSVDGEPYQYVGEKQQIYPWNLPYSHTTCFGEVKNLRTGKVISKSITHFDMNDLPEFLGTFKLTG
jgi:NAD(P)-dependent dehydrogenase (short-subunit alcohol dehydrogenase family)